MHGTFSDFKPEPPRDIPLSAAFVGALLLLLGVAAVLPHGPYLLSDKSLIPQPVAVLPTPARIRKRNEPLA